MKKNQNPSSQISKELEKIKRQNSELKALIKKQEGQINELNKELKLGETSQITEQTLIESEKKFRFIFEKAGLGIIYTDNKAKVLEINDAMLKILGATRDEVIGYHSSTLAKKFISTNNIGQLAKTISQTIVGKPIKPFQLIYKEKMLEISVTYDKPNKKIIGIIKDITDRKIAENKLQESELKFRTYVENSPTSIFIIDKNGQYRFVNQAAGELTGYSKSELLKMSIAGLAHTENSMDHLPAFQELVNKGRSRSEIIIKKKDGSKIFIMLNAVKLTPNSFIGFGEDITKRKEDEEKIKQSLLEKEILLKEIHHRVKNNFQVIASLLSLQSFQVKDKADLKLFQDSRNRVYMMAAVHEKLYQTENFSLINVKEFLDEVVTMVYKSSNIRSHVNLKMELSDTVLNIDDSIPLALIVNELITNSIKYAFPENRKGIIKIQFKSLDQGTFQLIYQDNGIGISQNIDFETANTFGLRLVRLLAQQIRGEAILQQNGWTTFKIEFKGCASVK